MLREVDATSLIRRAAAEALGTAFLLATVVGSGIMAERLSAGDASLTLLANSLATGAGLFALILTFGRFTGAHFNPVVTLADAILRHRPWREVPAYVGGQIVGAFAGVATAQVMFGEPLFAISQKARAGLPQIFAEAVATLGLLAVIFLSREGLAEIAAAVGAYITAAYWFTSSTSFANPAVTLARSLTDTFTGIRPADVPDRRVSRRRTIPGSWLTASRHYGGPMTAHPKRFKILFSLHRQFGSEHPGRILPDASRSGPLRGLQRRRRPTKTE